MKILINYANEPYRKAQAWNTWTGKHIAGFDRVYAFSPSDIDRDYYERHRDILDVARGNGLWLWKPYLIDKVLGQCSEGDIVFYADSGAFFVKKIDKLIASMGENEKIWVSDCPLLESCFTKPVCFEKMGCGSEEIRNSNQIQGGFILLKCCGETRAFVRQWLHYCEDYELMSPEGGLQLSEQRGRGFVARREDQSILSLLCKKNGIRAHRDPSQRGNWPETFYNPNYEYRVPEHPQDNYGTVLFLHKEKNPNLLALMRECYITLRSRYRYRRDRG